MKKLLLLLSGLILTLCLNSTLEAKKPRVIGLDAENIYVYDDAGNFTNDYVELVLKELYDAKISTSTTIYYFDPDTYFTFNGSTVALLVNGALMQSWFNIAEVPGFLLTQAGDTIITEGGDSIIWE